MGKYHIRSAKSKVSGTIFFRDLKLGTQGSQIPAANIECGIRIDHRKSGKAKTTFLVNKFYTDCQGRFSVSIDLHENEDVVIEVRTEANNGYNVKVLKGGLTLERYKFVSKCQKVNYGKDCNNWNIYVNEQTTDEIFLNSLTILSVCQSCYAYMNKYTSFNYSLHVHYPAKRLENSDAGEWRKFMRINKEWVGRGDYVETVAHEFGHFVANRLNFINRCGGPHTLHDNSADIFKNKKKGIQFAWNEGFAEFFAGLIVCKCGEIKKYFGVDQGGMDSTPTSCLPYNCFGEASEFSVQRALALMTYNSGVVGKQLMSDADLWKILISKKPKTFNDCLKYIRGLNVDRTILGKILSDARIAPMELGLDNGTISFTNSGKESDFSILDKFVIHINVLKKDSAITVNLADLDKTDSVKTIQGNKLIMHKCEYLIKDDALPPSSGQNVRFQLIKSGRKGDIHVQKKYRYNPQRFIS